MKYIVEQMRGAVVEARPGVPVGEGGLSQARSAAGVESRRGRVCYMSDEELEAYVNGARGVEH